MVAHHALFGVLAVLDGVRGRRGHCGKRGVSLGLQKRRPRVELSPANGVALHDILNSPPVPCLK
jgi:hypothetical protein